MDYLDGFRYTTLEPSATSKSKTLWGIEMEFDREQGQRTYTNFGFTNSGLMGAYLDTGVISANDVGVKVAEDEGFKEANYKAESEINITASRAQRNLNLYSTVEDLAHINNIENKNTTIGWKSDYSKDASSQKLKATQGTGNVTFDFTVNPWPNENNQLDLIYLNGDYGKKEFVQGQTIETGIKVENLDDNARERLVGQVYHPVSGEVVPGAEAYIDKNDMVVVKMPEGALKKDANGKTVINEDSIFSKAGYKNIQSLDVKFFARPRTEAEFRAVGKEANFDVDNYTPTGAGSEVINHKGESVTIDKQGIARYDHYNKVGEFKINLDDTMYYDQRFEDGNNDDTTKVTSSAVKPEEPFEVKIVPPENPGETDKSAADMNGAESRGEAAGELILDFIEKENKGKAPEDQWKIDVKDNDISKFTITPPASAKAGDFVAVAIKYTYTNGSTDTHWFHFVVQESTYIKPEYETQVNYPTREQTSPATVKDDDKRIKPDHYTLPDNLETDEEGNKFIKDDLGHKWTVSIDGKTGEVTAKPVKPEDFVGGEKLTVPVIAHYVDKQKPGEDITEDVDAYFVIKEKANMTARYNAKAGKSGDVLTSDIILNEEDKYNRRPTKFTLDSNTYVDDKGNTWNVSIDEDTGQVTATVPNAEEGQSIDGALLNVPVKAHYYENDGTEIATKEVEVQFVASGTDGTYVKKEDIPFETKVEKDSTLKKGDIKVITEGKKGSKEVTYVIKDSQIDESKTTEKILEKPQERLIHVGEGTEDGKHEIKETVEVPYEVEIQFDDSLKPGEQKVTQEGIPGEKTRTTTITIQDGNVTNTQVGEFTETKAPQKKIIKVGANTEGKVVHEEKIPFKYEISYDPNLKSGEYVIDVPGTEGTKKTTWTIKNSEIVGKPEVETTDPVNAVIRVGKKDFTGTLETKKTKAIEFETEYKVDNSLEPGKVVVEQEGSLGEEETTVTHTIVNGEVTKSEEGTPVQTKAPVKRIVKVGPGKTDGTHEYTNKIPYEVEIRVNPKLKKGERNVIQKGEVGEEKYTIKIENSKVVETSDPVVTKEAKKEIIEVGTEDYTGEFEYVDKEVIPFDTEVKINPNLEPNQIKEITPGENGSKERKITQKYTNGEKGDLVVGEYEITKQPVTRVIEVGPGKTDGTHTYTSKKPFEVEVRVNPELKKGEYKVVQKGVDGEEEYTITIENSKVTNISKPKETKAPVNEIIEVGEGSTDGEVKHVEEIPFKYQVEESDELKPGEYKIVKPGKVGTITTTWTIKDSQVVGNPKVERVEPEDALIQVGKGTPDGTHDFTEKKEIPFETIIEYDDSLEPGEEKVVQEGKPGEQERTNTIVIENGKVKEIKEGEFKTTSEPVNKIVKIGRKKPDGETTKTVEREIPYETKVIYDETLEAGFQQIENEGKPGKEKVTITTKLVDGKLVTTESTEKIEDKEDRVVRIGVKPVVKETELGHDTEYRYNPNLKEGEQKVIEEGSNGKVEYTITFNKEKGKIEVTEKRTEPTNKIVEIGYKTDGKVKVESEIPFEVEIIEDPEMEAGKTEVVQEGELGKKETTITIENSKEVSREEKTIKEPVKKIIKVGTKNVCEIPPVNPDKPGKPGDKDPGTPDKPGDKDPENPDKPGDKDPENPDKPGDKDPENPDKPGDKDPENPDKPGDKDPETPGKPGDKDPGTPGEDPKDPEQPGEDQKDPEQPGGEDPKDPETPGKTPENNGKTPENNGKTPENNGKTPENNGKTPGATGQVDGKSTTTNNKTPKRLPKSGSESEIMTLAMSGLLTAAGFIGLKKKRKDK
ncbi:MAG: G5 domain-containing protein [Finegoldia magna]|uniref:G5 domain-containing protein n=1 Tax=Finegoldia magna TaxID=1260 RepID=UPI0039A07E39